MKHLLEQIVQSKELHVKWLNTLSYLENAGARKIAACEHPTLVKEEMLKHAAEEFRHAHYLKKQMRRVSPSFLEDYALKHILGGYSSFHYLSRLDVLTARFLFAHVPRHSIREYAYLLVTYAIELRARALYPLYEEILRKVGSKVTVKSILLEEEEHLHEMRQGLEKMPSGMSYAQHVCSIENLLYNDWLLAIEIDVAFSIN